MSPQKFNSHVIESSSNFEEKIPHLTKGLRSNNSSSRLSIPLSKHSKLEPLVRRSSNQEELRDGVSSDEGEDFYPQSLNAVRIIPERPKASSNSPSPSKKIHINRNNNFSLVSSPVRMHMHRRTNE